VYGAKQRRAGPIRTMHPYLLTRMTGAVREWFSELF